MKGSVSERVARLLPDGKIHKIHASHSGDPARLPICSQKRRFGLPITSIISCS